MDNLYIHFSISCLWKLRPHARALSKMNAAEEVSRRPPFGERRKPFMLGHKTWWLYPSFYHPHDAHSTSAAVPLQALLPPPKQQ
jgi:hypothetical protein